ncbi:MULTISPECIES: hypothetical protein [unclassified Roseofilum]|uniref:hypothetical protein n=1 Tax=unclassified Roseofilum TaxID=2620099 RepID=UPI00298E7594|nr:MULTISPECIES: hypothetical protein [unclassified Roseofilum]
MPQVLAGHHQIERKLSEGGFGITYLARDSHRPGHPLCVVKQLKLQFNNPQGLKVAKRLFDQEGEILEELGNHDQTPRLLAFVAEGGQFYLVQEYIHGRTLSRGGTATKSRTATGSGSATRTRTGTTARTRTASRTRGTPTAHLPV